MDAALYVMKNVNFVLIRIPVSLILRYIKSILFHIILDKG